MAKWKGELGAVEELGVWRYVCCSIEAEFGVSIGWAVKAESPTISCSIHGTKLIQKVRNYSEIKGGCEQRMRSFGWGWNS